MRTAYISSYWNGNGSVPSQVKTELLDWTRLVSHHPALR